MSVWAWVEGDPEVMGDVADLAAELGVGAFAFAAGAAPQDLAAAGAEGVAVIEGPHDPERHAAAVAAVLGDAAPRAVLLPGTAGGTDLAPRLAARLGAACLLDCAGVRAREEGLHVLRWAFDDRAQEGWLIPSGLPLVATMRPGARGAPRPRPRPLALLPAPPPGRSRVQRRRRLPADPRSVRLAVADRIVAAGLGIGRREALAEVQALADALGAALGVSRPLADRGWAPFERQIGTTGQQVAPRLYVALGISGAVQHLAGVRDPEAVIAVNTDPACPMMARADLALVGDAREVAAALTRRLAERQATMAP